MANDTVITVIGNLTADPDLKPVANGSVANFTIASTPRTFDRQSNEWKDGETLFLRCSVWREQAENVVDSLRKGHGVIAQGRLKSRSYDTKEGEKRTVTELEIDEIGPRLRYATVTITKANAGAPRQQPAGAPQGAQWGGNQQAPAQWGNQPQSGQQWGQPQGGGFQ